MARVHFTKHLSRYFPELGDGEFTGATVCEVLALANERHPGLKTYIVNERGELRKHVNVFIDGAPIRDRQALSDAVIESTEIHFMQALSGG